MAIELFRFEENKIKINKPEVFLTSEFRALIDPKRNATKDDKKGVLLERAFIEFAYIYLYYDWKSQYADYNDTERKQSAISDSGITDEMLKDPLFIAACDKYQDLQDSRIMRLLKAAYRACDELELFYNSIDLQERDPQSGKPIFSHKDLVGSIANLAKLVEGLDSLVNQVKKEQAKEANVRGDAEEGMFDD